MPKLAKTAAKRVSKAETQSFDVYPEGKYTLRLRAVNAEKNGQPLVGSESGVPYWQWEFEIVSPEERDGMKTKGRRAFMTTSLGESSDWAMKMAFEAFGRTPDTDTDEMLGELCLGVISIGVIEKGKRKGEKTNQLDSIKPLPEGGDDEWEDDDDDEDLDDDDDDELS